MGRRWKVAGLVAGGLAAGLLVLLAAFPWGVLRGTVEREATERFGRPVTLSAVERVDRFGFHPTIAIRGLTVPQPGWAGPGNLATLREARVRFSAWALLKGDFRIEELSASGLRLALVRGTDRRTNWARPGPPAEGGSGPDLAGLTLTDTRVSYRDAVRDRSVEAAVTADPVRGLRAVGRATVMGAPAALTLTAAPLRAGAPWPFRARLEGERIAADLRGTTDRPLDTDAMTLDVRARADDLKRLDALIEAGLFHTQPVSVTARARHDADKWTITGLNGSIGRSRFTGDVTVEKKDGRTRLDGDLTAQRLDFEDLSSDEGLTRGAARERRIGPRLVPDLKVNLAKIDRTDGRIAFRALRIFGARQPTALKSMSAVLVLDRQRLTVEPLRIGFAKGAITGRAVVDQRGGGPVPPPVPTVTLDLRLRDSSVDALSSGAGVSARVDARAVLTGRGATIRDAVGRSSGRIGAVARDGALPARVAAAMGFDAGRVLMADGDGSARLRCAVAALDVRGGTARTGTLVIDTAVSRLDGAGALSFPGEALDFRLSGAPKGGGTLRVPGQVFARGLLRAPRLVVPDEVRSAGNILRALGRAVTGHQGPVARDADCGALATRALR